VTRQRPGPTHPVRATRLTHGFRPSFDEQDVQKCRNTPFYCDDHDFERVSWRVLKDPSTGLPYPGSVQETSWFKTHVGETAMSTKGCCSCESHSLPMYFTDGTVDTGFLDNKHTTIQVEIQALRACEVSDTDSHMGTLRICWWPDGPLSLAR
jgi:hypothetical protein